MTPNTVEIHDPSYARVPAASIKRISLSDLARKPILRLAMISNQKPNANELLQLVASGLNARRISVDPTMYRKTDEAHPAPPEVIRDINLRADLAIIAIGD